MRRGLVAAVAAVVVVGGLIAASVVHVEEGAGAWCAGRYLAPGWHLRPPLARVVPYPAGELAAAAKGSVTSREGASYEFTVRLRYRWDPERLARRPLDPAAVPEAIGERLAALDGRFSGEGIGESVRAALRAALAELPFEVVTLEATYPGEAFEKLRAAARPTGERVVFVGLDGLDWVLLDRLIREGRCPTFARMKRQGAWAELISHEPVLSPLIWTSIATGRRPEVHGILDFVVKDPETGRDVPITNQFRKVPAFWNVLSAVGLDVDVIDWWATYPAEPVRGVMVSERMFYQLFGIQPDRKDPANVYPPELLERILPLVVDAEDIGYDEVARFAAISREEFETAARETGTAENPFGNRINHLRKILATTRSVFAVARWVLEHRPADLTALYVEGTDTVGHRFAHFLPPKLSWVSEGDYRRYHDTMARYYEEVDRLLGELMAAAPPDTTWIVSADHGFFTGAARPSVPPDDFTSGAPQWHRMVGAFLAVGPHVRRGKIPHLDIYDLCRTLLWLEGAPISRRLEGRVATELMEPAWVAAHPPVEVPSYDGFPRTWERKGAAGALDEARVKELVALGYLSPGGEGRPHRGGAAAPTPGPGGAAPESAGGLEAKATELYNRGKLALLRGDLDEAERDFKGALEQLPTFAFAMTNLAEVERRRGNFEEALRWYTRALETGSPRLPGRVLADFVETARRAGRLERALGALDLLGPPFRGTPAWHAARGLALEKLGRMDEAEAAYRKALAGDPGQAVATGGMLRLARAGRPIDVDRLLAAHLRAVRGDLKRLNDFAVVCLNEGRPRWAEKALRRLLASDPTNFGVLSNLAAALQMQGRTAEAAEIFSRAVTSHPDNARLRYNYGAALAALGRWEEARTQLEKARELGLSGPRVYAALAKVQFRLGDLEAVRRTLEEGLRKNPGDRELGELLRALGTR